MKGIPDKYQDLLSDQKKAYASLATLMPDGSPQLTVVWFNTDNPYILINSAKGRVKDRNMRKNPHVALAIIDPDNPYRYIQIRGRVAEITQEGAEAEIHALSHKYGGQDYTLVPGEVRVTYKILPESVTVFG
ncbi:MAG: PPOX class F420-dependent oxidoreductase [Omnitrophica WOR_2 bacterium]